MKKKRIFISYTSYSLCLYCSFFFRVLVLNKLLPFFILINQSNCDLILKICDGFIRGRRRRLSFRHGIRYKHLLVLFLSDFMMNFGKFKLGKCLFLLLREIFLNFFQGFIVFIKDRKYVIYAMYLICILLLIINVKNKIM